VRAFPNKFPAVKEQGDPEIRTDNNFFTYASAFGKHEVIVETPDHSQELSDLPEEHIRQVLEMYVDRINNLEKTDGIQYVLVFKNQGKEAGTSIIHTHTQVVGYNKIPTRIEEKVNAVKNFNSCPYCDIINIEKRSDRRVFENNNFVSFTPYASRFPFEIWIFPKKHVKTITELDRSGLSDLANMLKSILMKLKELNAPYNFVLQNAPYNADMHFHIEILPRLSTRAGFEFGSDTIINAMSPESAAKFYRGQTD